VSAPITYRAMTYDSSRWDGFAFRDGDIVISTPPKCGTTWLQMICALLVLGTPDFDGDLDRISPWLDSLTRPHEALLADLEAQRHRRFIKTHTPLAGLPVDDRVTYVCVGRDPRDAGISYGGHLENFDTMAYLRARKAAVGLAGVEQFIGQVPTDELLRFRHWMLDDTPVTENGFSLRFTMHHLHTFWAVRESSNVVLLHYADLQADLQWEMRNLAQLLDVDVPEGTWPALVQAATFAEMRARASKLVPDAGHDIWRDDAGFFHRGVSGQWRDLLREQDLSRYASRVADLAPPDLVEWAHRGPVTPP